MLQKTSYIGAKIFQICTGCPKIIMPCLCGYCGGVVDSVISVFTQLRRSGFNLEFQTLFESILRMVAKLWERKFKISGCFKNSTSVVLPQYENKYFSKKGLWHGIKILPTFLKM